MATPTSLSLPDGLVGLPGLVRFEAHPVDDSDLVELVSLDDPAFVVAAVPLGAIRPAVLDELRGRGLAQAADTVLVFLSVHGDPAQVTANLAGPIVLDAGGRGRQLVLEGPLFPLRDPVAPGG